MDTGPFNAFLDYPQAVVSNSEIGPLAGLTLGVKDIFDVAGYPSGWGNPQRAAEAGIAVRTAPAVQKLLDSGARFVGKTQTDELAFSLMGQNAHYPFPINPKAPNRITGGSSSGSAAAVAGELVDIATGSDTGGSIRAPASFCGLIGLRTTHGVISLEGAMPLAPSFDTFGWFARDMRAYRKVAEILLGDAGSTNKKQVGNVRLVRSPLLDALVFPEARDEYTRLTSIISGQLGPIVDLAPPPFTIDELYWCFRRLQASEAWQSHGAWLQAGDRRLGPGVKERFDYARSIEAVIVTTETARRVIFRNWLADQLGRDGILMLPTVPSCAPRMDKTQTILQEYREQALYLLCWSGLSGFPQLTLPLGALGGAPFGVSLLATAGCDLQLLDMGEFLLRATGD